MRSMILAGILGSLTLTTSLPAAEPLEKGTVSFKPDDDQKNTPERYRLKEHKFDWQLTEKVDVKDVPIDVYRLTFPSPVKSETPENNTVHAEYYRPRGKGPFPGVIVLDITAGDQSVSRGIAAVLAQKKIAALFVQMAYYGPRRPADCKYRLISADYQHSMAAVRQTVLDVRRATAWLESRPEIDAKRLGVLGTSLGSFIGSLTAEMEPKLGRVAVLLGGGGIVDAYYDHPRAKPLRATWEAFGGTKKQLEELIAPADPLTCAANLKSHKVLMIAGKRDDIVPPKMAKALWEASGKQKIIWYDCTHYGAALYMIPAMAHIVKHFGSE
jgi:dienelactone hydrolase